MRTKIQQTQDNGQLERKKIFEMSDEELAQHHVSEHSQFKDPVWFLTNPTPGSRACRSTFNWNMSLLDGSKVTDARHTKRMYWAKKLVLTLLMLPSSGHTHGPGSMTQLQRQLRTLLSWMSAAGYHHPHELTPLVIREYLDQLPSILAARSYDGEIGAASATLALTTLIQLWNQRGALARMGVESIPRHPFDGCGAHTIGKGLATKARGWIKPLPDEVAIPLLNKAAWFLDAPAKDVLRLLDVVRDPLAGAEINLKNSKHTENLQPRISTRNTARRVRSRQFLGAFEFSSPNGDGKPWHEPLNCEYEHSSEHSGSRLARVRTLWEAVRDAAAIIVQATSGMRLSELLGILAGTDEGTGLPSGVRIELSGTGLYEWFVIRSQLSKTEEGLPREVDWVLGMRPVGSKEVPLAVRALQILDKLHEPWRACASTNRLILGGLQGAALPLLCAPWRDAYRLRQ